MITGTSSTPCESWVEPKVKRRIAEIGSMPTVPSARPIATSTKAWSTEPPLRRESSRSPARAIAKYSGGPNRSACSASHEEASTMPTTPSEPATKEPTRRDGQGGARAPLAGHLVAVDRGDHRARLPGHVDQDRGRGAAVHRAVVDAREHDQRGGGLEREGGRQQAAPSRPPGRCRGGCRPRCRRARRQSRRTDCPASVRSRTRTRDRPAGPRAGLSRVGSRGAAAR